MRRRKLAARSITAPWVISQDEPPSFDLDLYNDCQFIMNEECRAIWLTTDRHKTRHTLCRLPMPGTLTATIYSEEVAIQTLIANKDGSIKLNTVTSDVPVYVRGGMVNHTTGEVILEWHNVPNQMGAYIVASYQYNLENNRLLKWRAQ